METGRLVKAAENEFSELILEDLLAQGLSGAKLLEKFIKNQSRIKPAVEAMLSNAEDIAAGKAEYMTYEDVFDTNA